MMFWTKDTVLIPEWNTVLLSIAIIGVISATVVATCMPDDPPQTESIEVAPPSSVDP